MAWENLNHDQRMVVLTPVVSALNNASNALAAWAQKKNMGQDDQVKQQETRIRDARQLVALAMADGASISDFNPILKTITDGMNHLLDQFGSAAQ